MWKQPIFALRVLHSEGFFTCPIAANFHAYSLPSTLHQVEILRYYREDLGMSTYLWKVNVAPGWLRMPSDSKVPCQWSWPFLSTGEHLSNDPSTNITNPSNNAVKAAMHGPFQESIHTMWLPKGMNLQDAHCSSLLYVLHCVLVCCHANINKDITCCGTTSHSRATAASAVEKSWPRATALLATGSDVSGQVLIHSPGLL